MKKIKGNIDFVKVIFPSIFRNWVSFVKDIAKISKFFPEVDKMYLLLYWVTYAK